MWLSKTHLGLGDDVSVESLNGSLESPELHHSVGDLSGPQRNQTLVETSDTFVLDDLRHTLSINKYRVIIGIELIIINDLIKIQFCLEFFASAK